MTREEDNLVKNSGKKVCEKGVVKKLVQVVEINRLIFKSRIITLLKR